MTIKELYTQVCEYKSTQAKLDELWRQKNSLEQLVLQLKSHWEKEQRDLDRLENGTLASFLYNLTGKLDEKLDKEKQEALSAKASYDDAVFRLENVKRDFERYSLKLEGLKDAEKQYNSAVEQRLAQLKDQNPQIIDLERQLAQCEARLKEIDEAVAAGNTALKKVGEVSTQLSRADGWATWDVFGGGLVADMAKYSSLDKARQLISQMNTALAGFKTELSDVTISGYIDVEIDGLLSFADYFFDNIFTDAAVMQKIANARQQTNQISMNLCDAISRIESLAETEKQKQSQLKKQLEDIAVNT